MLEPLVYYVRIIFDNLQINHLLKYICRKYILVVVNGVSLSYLIEKKQYTIRSIKIRTLYRSMSQHIKFCITVGLNWKQLLYKLVTWNFFWRSLFRCRAHDNVEHFLQQCLVATGVSTTLNQYNWYSESQVRKNISHSVPIQLFSSIFISIP